MLKQKGLQWGVLGLTLLLGSCSSNVLLSAQDQEFIQKYYPTKTYHLRQSFFVGTFFAYDDRLFISERAFDERVLLEDTSKNPLLPSQPLSIIPLGTKVSIREIEFPTAGAITSRKLKSPRFFSWVTLDLVETPLEKPLVLVLPQEFKKAQEFKTALLAYLVEEDPLPNLNVFETFEKEAILHKNVAKNMKASALILARGYPDRITRKFQEGVKHERWQYSPNRLVFLKEDIVESFEGFEPTDLSFFKNLRPEIETTKP